MGPYPPFLIQKVVPFPVLTWAAHAAEVVLHCPGLLMCNHSVSELQQACQVTGHITGFKVAMPLSLC